MMNYNEWNEYVEKMSQWDVDEYYDNAIDRLFLEWEDDELVEGELPGWMDCDSPEFLRNEDF